MIKNIYIIVLCIMLNTSFLFAMSPVESIFPVDIGSYWLYTDQNGNELIRRVSEDKEIDGKKYKSFEYQPKLSNDFDFRPLIHATLFNTDNVKVLFYLSNELEDANKRRLKKEMDIYSQLAKSSFEEIYPPESGITIDIKYEIDIKPEKELTVIDLLVPVRKEWDVTTTEIKIKIIQDIKGLPDFGDAIDNPESVITLKITQTAKTLGPVNVVTPAGVFDSCSKIEYNTKTEVKSDNILTPELKAGETTTTIWYAPHVGIVKIHQESNKIFLNIFADSEMVKNTKLGNEIKEIISPTIITLVLKKYKINSPHMEDK